MKKVKFVLPLIAVFLTFIFLVSNQVWKSYWVKVQKLSYLKYEGRRFDVYEFDRSTPDVGKKTKIYLTYGQSNAANGGEPHSRFRNENVHQFLLGETYVYEDPSLGANGLGVSVWGVLGDLLVKKGDIDSVIFANAAYGGTPISHLKEGIHFEFLMTQYSYLMTKYGRVDAILFHQGESDNKPGGPENYYRHFSKFLENLNSRGVRAPIYISRASVCGIDSANTALTEVQTKLALDYAQIMEGPNTDLLSEPEFRFDGCHFSESGLYEHAAAWKAVLNDN